MYNVVSGTMQIHQKLSLHGSVKCSGEKKQSHLLPLVKDKESSTVKFGTLS